MICSSDLDTGYGINLIKRVHAVSPSCQRLIVLVRETQAVALGLSNQGVANQLNISLETVKTHVMNATGKLGAQGRTQLVVKAIV